jgi:hypothetical protein
LLHHFVDARDGKVICTGVAGFTSDIWEQIQLQLVPASTPLSD